MADAFPPAAEAKAAETTSPNTGGQTAASSTPSSADAGGAKPGAVKPGPRIIIKKYANRRLYNVTLEHLSEMVKDGVDFVVYDAKTNDDITRQVLTQIIFEAENSDQNLLPIQFLRQLIQLYGAQMRSLVPGYLEMSLDAFARQKDAMHDQAGAPFAGAQAYRMFEEQVRQNMTLFGQAMKMFSPFAYPVPGEPAKAATPARSGTAEPGPESDSLAELKTRIEEMQRQIERLGQKG